MSAIGISANLNNTNANLIYKAQHDAIVLCDRILTDTPNTTVSYIKRWPGGIDIELANLQGIFLAQGSQLIAQASSACRVEITLMSQKAPKDYQVIYPSFSFFLEVSDYTIDSQVCFPCSQGNRVLKIDGMQGSQISLNVENESSFSLHSSQIEIIQWIKPPQCFPVTPQPDQTLPYERIGILTNSWGQCIVTLVPPYLVAQISFVARNPNNNAQELLCFEANQVGDSITIYLLEFAGAPIDPYA